MIMSKNDKCIMYEIIKQKLTINQLIQINACRIHLQVSFISDMTRPNGKDIFSEFLRGERTTQVTSNHGWPKQESPSPNAKKLWSKTIREIFQLNSGSLPIIHRLKEWILSSICESDTGPVTGSWISKELLEPRI